MNRNKSNWNASRGSTYSPYRITLGCKVTIEIDVLALGCLTKAFAEKSDSLVYEQRGGMAFAPYGFQKGISPYMLLLECIGRNLVGFYPRREFG